MATTLYFKNMGFPGTQHWDTWQNWWTNAAHTTQGMPQALPALNDTVYLDDSVDTGPSVPVTLTHVYVGAPGGGSGATGASINITGVTGPVTFYNGCSNAGSIGNSATFNDTSYNDTNGLVGNNATFNNSSINYNNATHAVGAGANFFDSARNEGGIGKGATFHGSSVNLGTVDYGTGTGDPSAIFQDTATNQGTVGHFAQFIGPTSSYYYYTPGPANLGTCGNGTTFTGISLNGAFGSPGSGTPLYHVGDGAVFYDGSMNLAGVGAYAQFQGGSQNGGYNEPNYDIRVGANATWSGASGNYAISASQVAGNCFFQDSSTCQGQVTGPAQFSGYAQLIADPYYALVQGDATFLDSTYCDGSVSGTVTLEGNATLIGNGVVSGDVYCYNYSTITSGGVIHGTTYMHDYSQLHHAYLSAYQHGFVNLYDYSVCWESGIGSCAFHDNSEARRATYLGSPYASDTIDFYGYSQAYDGVTITGTGTFHDNTFFVASYTGEYPAGWLTGPMTFLDHSGAYGGNPASRVIADIGNCPSITCRGHSDVEVGPEFSGEGGPLITLYDYANFREASGFSWGGILIDAYNNSSIIGITIFYGVITLHDSSSLSGSSNLGSDVLANLSLTLLDSSSTDTDTTVGTGTVTVSGSSVFGASSLTGTVVNCYGSSSFVSGLCAASAATITLHDHTHMSGTLMTDAGGSSVTFNDWSWMTGSGTTASVAFNDASYFQAGATLGTTTYRATGILTIPPANKVTYPLVYGMQGGTQLQGTAQYGINGSGILGMP